MDVQPVNNATDYLPEEIDADADIYGKIDEIISAMDADGVAECQVKIRKYENNTWEQVFETTADAIPTNHDIGVKYGAGKYQIIFIWRSPRAKKGNVMRKIQFSLNEAYNELKTQADFKKRIKYSAETAALPAAAPAGMGDTQNLFMVLVEQMRAENTRLNGLLMELIRGNRNQGGGDLQKFYLEDLSRRSEFTMETQREAFKLGITMGQETSEDNQKTSETMQIINTLAEAAPSIISAFTSKKMVQKRLMRTPGAQEFLQNPAKVREVYEGLTEKIGADKAAKVAEKMDLEIPLPPTNQIKLKVV